MRPCNSISNNRTCLMRPCNSIRNYSKGNKHTKGYANSYQLIFHLNNIILTVLLNLKNWPKLLPHRSVRSLVMRGWTKLTSWFYSGCSQLHLHPSHHLNISGIQNILHVNHLQLERGGMLLSKVCSIRKSPNLLTYKICQNCWPSANVVIWGFAIWGPKLFCDSRNCDLQADLSLPQICKHLIYLLTNISLTCSDSNFKKISLNFSWFGHEMAATGPSIEKGVSSWLSKGENLRICKL